MPPARRPRYVLPSHSRASAARSLTLKRCRVCLTSLSRAQLYKMKLGELVTTVPTIGFNVERITYRNLEMTIWDVGGQDKIRALWRHYYENTDALIWLVDSADAARMAECKDELHHVLRDDGLRNAKVLVLANKQDLPKAARADRVAEALELHSLRGQQEWYVQPCSSIKGDGIFEGLEWLHKTLNSTKKAQRVG